jgi:hypothetical protein
LGYHGCDSETADKLLSNVDFAKSENDYDWLGWGVYFWEANPNRALTWAHDNVKQKAKQGITVQAAVVGAVINLGFCLDLITDNGITAVETAYTGLVEAMERIDKKLPENSGGTDLRLRRLDCYVMNYLHTSRKEDADLEEFDTVRGVFTEGDPIYPNAGFRSKTHIQICVRKQSMIKGVFRVPPAHFSS